MTIFWGQLMLALPPIAQTFTAVLIPSVFLNMPWQEIYVLALTAGHLLLVFGCGQLTPCSEVFPFARWLSIVACIANVIDFCLQGLYHVPLTLLYTLTFLAQTLLILQGIVHIGKHIGDDQVIRWASICRWVFASGILIGCWVSISMISGIFRISWMLTTMIALTLILATIRRAVRTAERFL